MRYLLVHMLEAASPEAVAQSVAAIDPPSIPHFAGETHVVIEPFADAVIDYLKGGDAATSDALAGIRPPSIRPLGQPLTRDDIRTLWDAHVVPTQADNAPPQSYEDRALAALLRAVYVALPATDKEPS